MHKSKTFFISDLHLCQEQPQITNIFLDFLKTKATEADALYILGDFFEVWVGDDDRNAFNQIIIQALRAFTDTGIPTYFMHGNRDYLIGKRFAKASGVQLLKEPTVINLYGSPILLLHGDSLCTLDIKHQKARKMMHNRFYQLITLSLPLKLRKHIAGRLRNTSKENKRQLENHIMDVTPDEVLRVMREAKVKTLIHGHTHRPAIHDIKIDDQDAQRIVLGAWHKQGNYLKIQADNTLDLVDFA